MASVLGSKNNAYWRSNPVKKAAEEIQYVCPITIESKIINVLGMVRIKNDGRFEWIRYKVKSIAPIGWKAEHVQGVSMSLERARLEVEKGFLKKNK